VLSKGSGTKTPRKRKGARPSEVVEKKRMRRMLKERPTQRPADPERGLRCEGRLGEAREVFGETLSPVNL